MRLLYSLLYTIAMIVALPYFFVAGLIRGKYLSSAKQRFGFIQQRSRRRSCWIHCVSVGEFLAAKPLIIRIRQEFPDLPLFVSTTTATGQSLAAALMPGNSFYFPFDWRNCIGRVCNRINPALVIVLETEIWPNFLWETAQRNIPAILVNGRISDRSFHRYFRFRSWLPRFTESWMQSSQDAERMAALGSDAQKMGNMKFDFRPQPLSPELRSLLDGWKKSDLLLTAGSTMPGEEEKIVDVFVELCKTNSLKLLIAPRHPQRFEEVARLLRQRGVACVQRSGGQAGEATVMLLDSIGELASSYELADIVFIGGTLGDHGGHNPIEPAFFGKAILSGQHYSNFRAVFEEFIQNDAILVSNDLRADLAKLVQDPEKRIRLGKAAKGIIGRNAGATEIAMQRVRKYLGLMNAVEPHQKPAV